MDCKARSGAWPLADVDAFRGLWMLERGFPCPSLAMSL